MPDAPLYHIGITRADLGHDPPTLALLCGDPDRTEGIARRTEGVSLVRELSTKRGLNSYLLQLPSGRRLLAATSGMDPLI